MCFIIILAFAPNDAVSQTTGNELYQVCTSRDDADQLSCIYYIKGVLDTLNFLAGLPGISEKIGQFCTPEGVNMKQMTDAVVGFLRQNSATRHGRAEVFIMAAIVNTWPCPK